MIRLALLATLVLFVSCASDGAGQGSASSDVAASGDLSVARDLAFSHTYEVWFGQAEQPSGYLVEFYRVPLGIEDQRIHTAGTALVQGPDLVAVGMITPGGRGFRFDEQGRSLDVGFGSRSALVAAMLGGSEPVRYVSAQPGVSTP